MSAYREMVSGAVVDLVIERARRTPRRPALIDGETVLDYDALERRAATLRGYLRSCGVRPGDVVALCLPRSAAQIVAALAVMTAGAAYLPLDPAQPRERLSFALTDARTTFVLTAAGGAEFGFPGAAGTAALFADGTLGAVAGAGVYDEPAADVAAPHADDLAYVIYTSGSTGRPKGVEITHRGLANLCAWHNAAFAVTSADRASHVSAVGFDAAVWEVWPYLCAGATVVVASDATARDPRALHAWLLANGITLTFAVTPIAERLIELEYPPSAALRIMLTGADTLHRRPRPGLPFTLYNNYGPTETAVVATSGRVEPGDYDAGLPAIGTPIANTQIFILDPAGVPLPDGTAGEICIAGDGLARGYRGNPELTAERFRSIAIDGGSPVRVYRTGDRGRRDRDGSIAFLGRLDDQMKLRGFRVEPREIEAALDAQAAIAQSAVVVRDFASGDARLVAFVVPRPGQRLELGAIEAGLAVRLPAYMLPSAYVELPALPLTAHGKVDRAALQAREIGTRLDAAAYVAPRTPTEQRVMELVAALLKLERVSIEDDFFRLGGHSLLGTQLIARLRDAFGVKIGLRFLFESPTVAALASEVDRQQALRPIDEPALRAAPLLNRRA